MNVTKKLIEMFEADRNARNWNTRFPSYGIHSAVGAKLWWPPIEQVWRFQGEPPKDAGPEKRASWAEAWEFVSDLHDEYLTAKGAIR